FNVAAIKSEASKEILRELVGFIEQSSNEVEINALLARFFKGIGVDDTEVHEALKEALVGAIADWDTEALGLDINEYDKQSLITKVAGFFHEVYLSDVNSQDYDEETKKEEIGKLSLLTVGYYEKVSPENLSDENRLLYIASMIAVPLTDDFEARKDVSASDFLNKSLSLARECGPDGKMGAAVLIAAWYNSLKTKLTSLKSNDAGNLKNIKFLAKEAINSSKEKIKSRAVFASFFGGGLDKRQKMKMNTYIISSYLLLIESEFDVSKSKCSELREFLKNDGVLVDGDEEEINDEDIFLEEVYASLVKRELYSSFEEVFQDNPALTISKFLDGEEAYINKLKDGAWKELDPVFIVSLRKELLEALEGIDEDALPISEEQFLSEWNKAIPPGELLAVFEKTCLSEASPDPFESWKKLCISAGFIREYSSDEEIFDLLGQAGSLGLKTIEPLVKGGFELFSLDESRLDKYTEALLRAPEESIPDLESYLEGLGLTNSRWFKSSLRRVQVSFTEKLAEGSNPELLAVKSKVDALLEKGSADKEFTLEGFIQENLPASEGEADKKFLLRLSSALDKVAGERVNKLLVYFLGEITLDNKDAHNALRAAIASIEDEAVRDKLSSKIGAFFKKHYRKVVVEDGGDRRKIKEIKALYNHYYHSISVANLSSSDLFSYYNDLMNTKLDALEAEGIAPQEIYDRLFSILEYLESPGAPKVLGLSPKVRKLELLSWCKLNEAKFTEEKRAENILKVNINDELAEPGAIMHLGTITLIKNLYSLDSSLFDKDTLSEFLKRELRAEKEAKAVLSGQEIEEQKKRIAMIETVLAEVEKVEGDA
ncbi:MAG: hypothetical protein L7U87_04540, partial [Chlamydiales bacterium]|nr:hypothetical protein [Chlamydiales bacterium]